MFCNFCSESTEQRRTERAPVPTACSVSADMCSVKQQPRGHPNFDAASVYPSKASQTISVLPPENPSSPCMPSNDVARLDGDASSSSRSDLGSTTQPCPICLNPIKGDAFLDPCFHSFCYHCILQWEEMAFTHPSMEGETCLECPLCKTRSSCIIHNVVLNTFQRHYLFGASPSEARPFLLSQAHYQRLYVYKNNLHSAVAETLDENVARKRKMLHISGNKSLQEWLRRELQALMQEEDVELVMQFVLGVLEQFERKQKLNSHAPVLWTNALVDAIKPFLFEDAECFCKEIQNFLTSGLNVKAYDLLVEEAFRAHTLGTEGLSIFADVSQCSNGALSSRCSQDM